MYEIKIADDAKGVRVTYPKDLTVVALFRDAFVAARRDRRLWTVPGKTARKMHQAK